MALDRGHTNTTAHTHTPYWRTRGVNVFRDENTDKPTSQPGGLYRSVAAQPRVAADSSAKRSYEVKATNRVTVSDSSAPSLRWRW